MGGLQIEKERGTMPEGATGYHKFTLKMIGDIATKMDVKSRQRRGGRKARL